MGFLDAFKKPKASVSLTVPEVTVALGDDLKGAIAISCNEEIDASEIRGELVCVEKRRREAWVYDERSKRNIRRVYWDAATLHSAHPKVAGQVHLTPGFSKTFPLSVNIPAGGRESFDGMDGNVNWSIKGVIGIKGRPDVTSETIELQVVRPSGTTIKKKEQMVPCEYCQALMTDTTTFCPNCGAPRKV